MLNFEFYNPTRILFGTNKIPELARHVPADARVLLLVARPDHLISGRRRARQLQRYRCGAHGEAPAGS